MEKYLRRLCKAILEDRFNEENYRQRRSWYGNDIQTEPLFCSYGKIGFTVMVFEDYRHICTISFDADRNELTIDDEDWKDYINSLYLEDFGITDEGDGLLSLYTDAGEDMEIQLDKIRKENLQEYIDNFDINGNVLMWWQNGSPGNGVPFDNVKEHYEDYEAYLEKLQKACDKMPY